MRGRPHVGLGNIRVLDSGGRYHVADALAPEHTTARINPSRAAGGRTLLAERD